MKGMSSTASPSSVAKISAGDLTSTTSPGRKGCSFPEFRVPTESPVQSSRNGSSHVTNDADGRLLARSQRGSEGRETIEVGAVEVHGSPEAFGQRRPGTPAQRLFST